MHPLFDKVRKQGNLSEVFAKSLTCLKDGAKNEHAAEPWFNRESRQNSTKWGQLVSLIISFNLAEENLSFDHSVNGGRLHTLGEELTDRTKAKKPVGFPSD